MTKVLVTQVSKLIPQVGRLVHIEDKQIAIFQLTDGRIFAIDDICPLTQGPVLESIVAGEYLYEPMRDYKISLITGQIEDTEDTYMNVYPVEVVANDIYIEV